MTGPRQWFGGQRCGWCITNEHDSCIVALEMNADKWRGRPKDRRQELRTSRKGEPAYPWFCGCWCATSKTKCVDCGQHGVQVGLDSRCVKGCDQTVSRKRLYVKEPR